MRKVNTTMDNTNDKLSDKSGSTRNDSPRRRDFAAESRRDSKTDEYSPGSSSKSSYEVEKEQARIASDNRLKKIREIAGRSEAYVGEMRRLSDRIHSLDISIADINREGVLNYEVLNKHLNEEAIKVFLDHQGKKGINVENTLNILNKLKEPKQRHEKDFEARILKYMK